MIEKLSQFLAKKLTAGESSNTSTIPYGLEVYQYGIECIINTSVPLFIIFIYSLLIHQGIEMIIWTFSFLMLRNYLGGYHASSHIRCMILSTITGIIAISLQSIFPYTHITFKLILSIFCFALYIKFGPVTQKDFPAEAKQNLYISGISLFFFFIVIFSLLMHFKFSIGNSIFFGILTSWIFYAIEIIKNV